MPIKLFGHPLYPVLAAFPYGLLTTSLAFDAAYLFTRNIQWSTVSFWMLLSGLAAGSVAWLIAWADYLEIPDDTRARDIGLWHALGLTLTLLLFALSWQLRRVHPEAPNFSAFLCSYFGLMALCVTGWLGAELIHRLGFGVDPGANFNAPSSLSDEPASIPSGPRRLTLIKSSSLDRGGYRPTA